MTYGPNLIANAGFETNTTGWFAYGAGSTITRVTTDPHSGDWCLEVVSGGAGGRGVTASSIPAPVQSAYRFSVWARGTGSIRLSIRQADAANSTLRWLDGPYQALAAGWQEYQFSVAGHDDTARIDLYVQAQMASTTFFIDDAELPEIVPDPLGAILTPGPRPITMLTPH